MKRCFRAFCAFLWPFRFVACPRRFSIPLAPPAAPSCFGPRSFGPFSIFCLLFSVLCLPYAALAALEWEATSKKITADAGATTVHVAFGVTNRSAEPVVIFGVEPSCGCTVAEGLILPWTLKPGAKSELKFLVDVKGKFGTLKKSILVESSAGATELNSEILVPENLSEERQARIDLVRADRQAVFKGDCVRCHVEPTRGTLGRELYAHACGICHDAAHRASMVPELRVVAPHGRRTAAYWEQWIRHGKPGSLMPAFARAAGGPLDDKQIESLVRYLASSGVPPPPPPALPPLPPPVARDVAKSTAGDTDRGK